MVFKKNTLLVIILIVIGTQFCFSQNEKGPYGQGTVVVKKSPFRPKKVVVYHPVWGPSHSIHRRWVYFPTHNIYWDNWRSMYAFNNGKDWVIQPTPPNTVANINLEAEKHYELKKKEDDIDDIYLRNDHHRSEYKAN